MSETTEVQDAVDAQEQKEVKADKPTQKRKKKEPEQPTFGTIEPKTYFKFVNQMHYTCVRLNDGKYITLHDGQTYPTGAEAQIDPRAQGCCSRLNYTPVKDRQSRH